MPPGPARGAPTRLRRRARRHLHRRHRQGQRLDAHDRPHRPGPGDHQPDDRRRGRSSPIPGTWPTPSRSCTAVGQEPRALAGSPSTTLEDRAQTASAARRPSLQAGAAPVGAAPPERPWSYTSKPSGPAPRAPRRRLRRSTSRRSRRHNRGLCAHPVSGPLVDPGPLRHDRGRRRHGAMSGLFGIGGAVISTPRDPGARCLHADRHRHDTASHHPGAARRRTALRPGGLVDGSAVRATTPVGIVAAVAGALLTEVIPGNGHALMLATAALLAVSGGRMIRNSREDRPPPPPLLGAGRRTVVRRPRPASQRRPRGGCRRSAPRSADDGPARSRRHARGPSVGPAGHRGRNGDGPGLHPDRGLPLKRAIATSLACVGIFAVPGTITHALLGNIDWRFALLLTVG